MVGEKRFMPGHVELRFDGDRPTMLVGRAVVYDSWSELLYDHFRERIKPGAFDEHLATDPDVVATIDHNPQKLLGRTSAGTLRLRPDASGIPVEVDFPDLSYARDLAVSVKRGDIRGMSFIFDITDDEWQTKDGVPHRTVTKAQIYEVTFTGYPAYPASEADLRSLAAYRASVALLKRRVELALKF